MFFPLSSSSVCYQTLILCAVILALCLWERERQRQIYLYIYILLGPLLCLGRNCFTISGLCKRNRTIRGRGSYSSIYADLNLFCQHIVLVFRRVPGSWHVHACTHARTHARTRARTRTCTHTCTHTHTHKHTFAHMRTQAHIRTHAHTCARTNVPLLTQKHTCTCVDAYRHKHTNTDMQTDARTHYVSTLYPTPLYSCKLGHKTSSNGSIAPKILFL